MATVKRCDVDAHMRILEVFGGAGPAESQYDKGIRHAQQLEIYTLWPELHEALMAAIGLDRTGAPLDGDAST